MHATLEDMPDVLAKLALEFRLGRMRSIALIAVDNDGVPFNRLRLADDTDAKIIGNQAVELCEHLDRHLNAGG